MVYFLIAAQLLFPTLFNFRSKGYRRYYHGCYYSSTSDGGSSDWCSCDKVSWLMKN